MRVRMKTHGHHRQSADAESSSAAGSTASTPRAATAAAAGGGGHVLLQRNHIPHHPPPPHPARCHPDDPSAPLVRLMCSYGGRILPRPHDDQLRYVGGETRIVAVPRSASFAALRSRLSELHPAAAGGQPPCLKYQLPHEASTHSSPSPPMRTSITCSTSAIASLSPAYRPPASASSSFPLPPPPSAPLSTSRASFMANGSLMPSNAEHPARPPACRPSSATAPRHPPPSPRFPITSSASTPTRATHRSLNPRPDQPSRVVSAVGSPRPRSPTGQNQDGRGGSPEHHDRTDRPTQGTTGASPDVVLYPRARPGLLRAAFVPRQGQNDAAGPVPDAGPVHASARSHGWRTGADVVSTAVPGPRRSGLHGWPSNVTGGQRGWWLRVSGGGGGGAVRGTIAQLADSGKSSHWGTSRRRSGTGGRESREEVWKSVTVSTVR
ncbi:unnamed protein product [Musa textilis]